MVVNVVYISSFLIQTSAKRIILQLLNDWKNENLGFSITAVLFVFNLTDILKNAFNSGTFKKKIKIIIICVII